MNIQEMREHLSSLQSAKTGAGKEPLAHEHLLPIMQNILDRIEENQNEIQDLLDGNDDNTLPSDLLERLKKHLVDTPSLFAAMAQMVPPQAKAQAQELLMQMLDGSLRLHVELQEYDGSELRDAVYFFISDACPGQDLGDYAEQMIAGIEQERMAEDEDV